MRTAVILSTLATSALAFPSPLSPIARADTWTVAPNSTVTCAKSDKIIGFLVGPQMDTVLNDACAAMMPVCAYPDRAPKDTVCPQVMDWKLDGPKTSTQNANVEDAATGNKLSGWAVKFSVTPAPQADSATSVMWTKADCYGYFKHIVNEQVPVGCHNSMGSGIGSMKVGGTATLKDTMFDIKIVERQ